MRTKIHQKSTQHGSSLGLTEFKVSLKWEPKFTSIRFGPSLGLSSMVLMVGSAVLLSFFATLVQSLMKWPVSKVRTNDHQCSPQWFWWLAPLCCCHSLLTLPTEWFNSACLILSLNGHFHLDKGRVNFATLDLGGSCLLSATAVILQLCQNFCELFVQQTSNQEQFLVHLFQTAKITSF